MCPPNWSEMGKFQSQGERSNSLMGYKRGGGREGNQGVFGPRGKGRGIMFNSDH